MSRSRRVRVPVLALAVLWSGVGHGSAAAAGEVCQQVTDGTPDLPNPVLFVTQMPIAADFATIGSVFANHRATMQAAGRGGDLWIRYPNGQLCNLTAEAGFGVASGLQGGNAIAVRGPAVHWSGTKAVFSMVVGGPDEQFEVGQYRWQLYEVTGLGQGQATTIAPVPNQPLDFNNVSPIYLSDDRILFVSDRPRNGAPHLYPQLDEYESTPTNTGLWVLDSQTGELELFDHAPSGSFTPIVDSAGRVVFTRWDHLQQDQQADADALNGTPIYGAFDWSSEAANAQQLPRADELFPEPRAERTDLLAGTPWEGHRLNSFFPWEVRQDGTGMEMVNHVGRHEMQSYFNRARNDDPNLTEFIAGVDRPGFDTVENLLQMREHPQVAGTFFGTDAPEFDTHASGRIVSFSAPVGANPDGFAIQYVTHPSTSDVIGDGDPVPADHSGHYRDPLVLSGGTVLVAHTAEARGADNEGTRAFPDPRYDFQIKRLVAAGNGYQQAGVSISGGIDKTLSYWDPDVLVSYSGPLWELDPVEVLARTAPAVTPHDLALPEQTVFDQQGVAAAQLQQWLRERELALLVVRDATTRDEADDQQPYNLQVAGGGASTIGSPGTVYTIDDFQIVQGDQVRGYSDFTDGRRVLARWLHDLMATESNPPNPGGPPGSVPIAADGSVAAFVPAQRALSWQTTDPGGEAVVRERFWITFQPGEIRACDGCHGVNTVNQAGQAGVATNPPQALADLLQHWQSLVSVFADGFESANTTSWSSTTP